MGIFDNFKSEIETRVNQIEMEREEEDLEVMKLAANNRKLTTSWYDQLVEELTPLNKMGYYVEMYDKGDRNKKIQIYRPPNLLVEIEPGIHHMEIDDEWVCSIYIKLYKTRWFDEYDTYYDRVEDILRIVKSRLTQMEVYYRIGELIDFL
jgi:hypothetical protein